MQYWENIPGYMKKKCTYVSFKETLMKILLKEIPTENPKNIKDGFSSKIYCYTGI